MNEEVPTATLHTESQTAKVDRYYRLHSRIYDGTRWSFLFGRDELIDRIILPQKAPRILEIGCGTGRNTRLLNRKFPAATITSLDLSADMLKVARQNAAHPNIQFVQQAYGSDFQPSEPFDLILCSYSLTMMGPQINTLLDQMNSDLAEHGKIAVVDFGSTRFEWYRWWMRQNHVRIDNSLVQSLRDRFLVEQEISRKVYLGLWSYLMFIGTKRP